MAVNGSGNVVVTGSSDNRTSINAIQSIIQFVASTRTGIRLPHREFRRWQLEKTASQRAPNWTTNLTLLSSGISNNLNRISVILGATKQFFPLRSDTNIH